MVLYYEELHSVDCRGRDCGWDNFQVCHNHDKVCGETWSYCCSDRHGLRILNTHRMRHVSSQSSSDIAVKLQSVCDCCLRLARRPLDCSKNLGAAVVELQLVMWQRGIYSCQICVSESGRRGCRWRKTNGLVCIIMLDSTLA